MIVAYESLGFVLTIVASSTSGRLVVLICDGSAFATAGGGVHSEQNMLRVANGARSLLRVCFAGCAVGSTAATRGAFAESPRYFASTTWLVAFAANTAQMNTAVAPRTQKYRLIKSCIIPSAPLRVPRRRSRSPARRR